MLFRQIPLTKNKMGQIAVFIHLNHIHEHGVNRY